nr:MAG TPA_asm: hypothetical protein [Caudoviricetes sp.]
MKNSFPNSASRTDYTSVEDLYNPLIFSSNCF